MFREQTKDLVRLCNEAVREGNDFSMVWSTVLKGNDLVAGVPHSKFEGKRPVLEIWLITGQRLVFDNYTKEFKIK